jgi:hypothetical protein
MKLIKSRKMYLLKKCRCIYVKKLIIYNIYIYYLYIYIHTILFYSILILLWSFMYTIFIFPKLNPTYYISYC